MTQLWLEGHRMDMGSTRVAQTFQVNDINELTYRQATLTNKLKLPKTPKNVQVFDMLGITGNQSTKPYRKLEAKLTMNGVELISRGWAVVEQSPTGTYDVAVYDGYIHFIKAIENKVITNIGISELNHLKNLTTVQDSWDEDSPYRYIVADYNGKMTYDVTKLNLDYLVPSVNVKWLWDKIFEYFEWEYEGSVFDTEKFQNLWMTYPKSIGESSQTYTEIYSKNWTSQLYYYNPGSVNPTYMPNLTGAVNETLLNDVLVGNQFNANYPITTPATVRNTLFTATQDIPIKIEVSGYFNQGEESTKTVIIRKNTEIVSSEEVTGNETFELVYNMFLVQGDTISVEAIYMFNGVSGNIDTVISSIDGNDVDFEDALIEFKVRDFIQEIMWRFALTPFTDKHTNKIKFLTHREWLQSIDNLDWSHKFQGKTNEKYIVGRYAQRSYLRYKYNDSNQSHNDGYLFIDNKNLDDSVDIIRSIIFSPEPRSTPFFGDDRNIYRLWNKENKDDGTVDYKELSGRFYFLRSENKNMAITVGSEFQGNEANITSYPVASYDRLGFSSVVEDYYTPIYAILNRSKILDVENYINELDVNSLDFSKLIYIKQLSSYFILNKLPNFINPGVSKCEMVQVTYGAEGAIGEPVEPNQIVIDATAIEPDGFTSFVWYILTDYAFLNYLPASATIYMKQLDASPYDGGSYTGLVYSGAVNVSMSQFSQAMPLPLGTSEGWYEVQIIDVDGLASNIDYVFLGTDDISTPNIEVSIEALGGDLGQYYNVEHQRDVNYRFNNFTPSSATLTIEPWDYLGNIPTGPGVEVTLSILTADTDHTYVDFDFPPSFGFYRVTLATDTITFQQVMIVF